MSASNGLVWALDDRNNSNLMLISGQRIQRSTPIGSIADGMYADATMNRVWVLSTQDDKGLLSEYDARTLELIRRVTLPERGLSITRQSDLLVSGVGFVYVIQPSDLTIRSRITPPTGAIGPLTVNGADIITVVEDTAESSAHLAVLRSADRSLVQTGATLKGAVSTVVAGRDLWIANTDRTGAHTILSHSSADDPAHPRTVATTGPGASAWTGGSASTTHWWTYEPAASSLICRSDADGRELARISAPDLIVGPGQVAGPVAEIAGSVYFATVSDLDTAAVPAGCGR